MGRVLGGAAAVLVLAAGIGAVSVYSRITSFESEQLTDDVYVIRGFGGNVAVLATGKGTVVVDTMAFPFQGRRLREVAEQLGGGPPRVIVNTHYHRDHTHGNPGFAPGSRIVATERTRAHLVERDGDYWRGEAGTTLPNDTFEGEHEFAIGGKTIRCLHPGRGHTDGDLVVLFVEDRVLHAGDLFQNRSYPRIDLEAGGSAREWGATLERVLALDFDRVIPGHGAVSDREGLRAFQRFIREVWRVAEEAARAGRSVEEVLATAELEGDADYDVRSLPFVFRIDRESVLREACEEASMLEDPGPEGGAS